MKKAILALSLALMLVTGFVSTSSVFAGEPEGQTAAPAGEGHGSGEQPAQPAAPQH